MRYDAVLYDFDGTLADTVPVIMDSFQYAFIKVTGQPEKNEAYLLSTIGLPLTEAFAPYDISIRQALYDAFLEENNRLLFSSVQVFDSVAEGLAALRSLGVRQGVVTSKRRDAAVMSITRLGLAPFFETIITREDTNVHKPSPEPILTAMKKMGLKDFSRVLYVGDSIHDLRCAANAGVDSAAVNWTYMPREELAAEKPKYWLNRLTDLPCILDKAEL